MHNFAKNYKVPVNELGKRIGEHHPGAKLLDREVEMVLELREAGYTLASIAEKFDVSKGCIWKIVSGLRRGQAAARFAVVKCP